LPLTFPSHAAAILPLYRFAPRALHPTALVVGSAAPDLAYLLVLDAIDSHSPEGLAAFSIPAGLLAFLWLEALVLPALHRSLPALRGVELARFTRTRGLPRGLAGWLGVLCAVGLGALSHVLWDGFTHAKRWPARALYPQVLLTAGPYTLPLAGALQHLSSLLGLVIFVGYLARLYPRLPAARGGTRRDLAAVSSPALLLGGAALLWRWFEVTQRASWGYRVWLSFWAGVAGALIGLTLGCLLERARRRGAAPSTPGD
jgi:hypothetical protein